MSHLTSECCKLAQREYKRRHDNVARYVHWQLCGKAELERADQWYKHTPEQVVENTGIKFYGISMYNVMMVEATLKLEGRTSSSLINRQKRLRS